MGSLYVVLVSRLARLKPLRLILQHLPGKRRMLMTVMGHAGDDEASLGPLSSPSLSPLRLVVLCSAQIGSRPEGRTRGKFSVGHADRRSSPLVCERSRSCPAAAAVAAEAFRGVNGEGEIAAYV